jgi:hypothetical protein
MQRKGSKYPRVYTIIYGTNSILMFLEWRVQYACRYVIKKMEFCNMNKYTYVFIQFKELVCQRKIRF